MPELVCQKVASNRLPYMRILSKRQAKEEYSDNNNVQIKCHITNDRKNLSCKENDEANWVQTCNAIYLFCSHHYGTDSWVIFRGCRTRPSAKQYNIFMIFHRSRQALSCDVVVFILSHDNKSRARWSSSISSPVRRLKKTHTTHWRHTKRTFRISLIHLLSKNIDLANSRMRTEQCYRAELKYPVFAHQIKVNGVHAVRNSIV